MPIFCSMEYFSILETEKKIGIPANRLVEYARLYLDYFDAVCSPDFKEIFFAGGDLDLLRQVHEMSELLRVSPEGIKTALSHLLSRRELAEHRDTGEKEAAELTQEALRQCAIPQSPFEKKLVGVVDGLTGLRDRVDGESRRLEILIGQLVGDAARGETRFLERYRSLETGLKEQLEALERLKGDLPNEVRRLSAEIVSGSAQELERRIQEVGEQAKGLAVKILCVREELRTDLARELKETLKPTLDSLEEARNAFQLEKLTWEKQLVEMTGELRALRAEFSTRPQVPEPKKGSAKKEKRTRPVIPPEEPVVEVPSSHRDWVEMPHSRNVKGPGEGGDQLSGLRAWMEKINQA